MPEAFLLKEKRVHPRITVKIPLVFEVIDDQEEIDSLHNRKKKEVHHPTLNVSLGGMFIMAGQPLKDGNILNLEILIPGSLKKLNLTAEVVWSNEMGGGIQFLTIDKGDMKSLKAYLDKVSSRSNP